MIEFLLYLAKVSLVISLFWVGYQLILRRNTHFLWARIYLLGGIVCALLLPFWQSSTDLVSSSVSAFGTESSGSAGTILVVEGGGFAERLDWSLWFAVAYFGGLSLMIFRTILIQFQVRKLWCGASKERFDDFSLLRSKHITAPFSFLHYIFLPTVITAKEAKVIIAHEQAHIRQRHSLDIVFVELFLLLQWFNPIAWRYKKSLLTLHEYLADRSTLAQGIDKSQYQLLLLRQSVGKKAFALANAFNEVTSINRIKMMNQTRSTQWSRLKFFLLLPLLGLSLYSFQILPQSDTLIFNGEDEIIIKGQVLAATDHNPIAGAAVLVENTKIGTLTDENGKFLMRIPAGSSAKIAFSFVGMATHHIEMDRSGVVTVFMAASAENSSHTISTAPVKLNPSEEKATKPAKRPLMVVDGEITDKSFDKESIDPANIESVSVLKGESAVAIYGEKGRNGVVIITTKKK